MAIKRLLFCLFLLIFIIPLVSSQNISINYPELVRQGEEFKITLGLIGFDEDTYDIKIDITINGKRIAKIFNEGSWKSTFYYVNNIIDNGEEKDFILKINEDAPDGESNIVIRIKDSSGNAETYEGYKIEMSSIGNNPPSNKDINNTEESSNDVLNYIVTDINNSVDVPDMSPEIIILNNINSKDIKTDNSNKNQEENRYAVYGLIGFCILLIFLYLIKKNKQDKNEFTI